MFFFVTGMPIPDPGFPSNLYPSQRGNSYSCRFRIPVSPQIRYSYFFLILDSGSHSFLEITPFSDVREEKAWIPHFEQITPFSDDREEKAWIPHFEQITPFSDVPEEKAWIPHFEQITPFSDDPEEKAWIHQNRLVIYSRISTN
jgi:hypothetical protein